MKKSVLKVGLCALVAANMAIIAPAIPVFQGVTFAAEAAKSEAKQIKGRITNISQKAKTIALSKKDKSFFLLKFTEDTKLVGVESSKNFKVGEAIKVEYSVVNGENIATSLAKALVKLPKGVKEIKTDALASLIETDKNAVITDARPGVKYAESHLAGSISIPFSKVVKMGDKGNTLFEKYKDKQLVFYCGGPT